MKRATIDKADIVQENAPLPVSVWIDDNEMTLNLSSLNSKSNYRLFSSFLF